MKLKNGRVVYSIDEKIDFFIKRINDRNISERERKYATKRIKQLIGQQRIYNVVLIPDERMFKYKTGRVFHDYIISKNKKGFLGLNIVTHRKLGDDYYKLEAFDGNSYFHAKVRDCDKYGNRIHYMSVYESKTKNNKLTNNDKDLIRKTRY